jgi:lactate dehydrogenase-like 2-hydroxyacid dehydrogenase
MAIEILVTAPMAPIERLLEPEFTLHRPWLEADPALFLRKVGGQVRGAVTYSGAPPMDAALIASLPRLEIIANFGAGYESVDIEAARARGLIVTASIGINAPDVAELAFGLLLDVARGISAGDRYVRDGLWPIQGRLPFRHRVSGRTLGILGLGQIGRAIATRATAFDMPVLYHNRRPNPDLPYRYEADAVALAKAADFLVVTVPGGPETRHLVDRRMLDALGPDGILINVGRGSAVDEAALIAALTEGTLGGAGLDVFEREPEIPAALLALPNVVVQPHQGGATHEGVAASAEFVLQTLRDHFAARPVDGRVA